MITNEKRRLRAAERKVDDTRRVIVTSRVLATRIAVQIVDDIFAATLTEAEREYAEARAASDATDRARKTP